MHMKLKLILLSSFVFCIYLSTVSYTDITKVSLIRNHITGEVRLDSLNGIKFTAPWVSVSRIPVNPFKVCITSASRNLNCKLVKFNPTNWKELVAREGFRYYWLDNRISINMGYSEEYRGFRDLLRGYSFDENPLPFITTLQ